jgi:hypothetical protein
VRGGDLRASWALIKDVRKRDKTFFLCKCDLWLTEKVLVARNDSVEGIHTTGWSSEGHYLYVLHLFKT